MDNQLNSDVRFLLIDHLKHGALTATSEQYDSMQLFVESEINDVCTYAKVGFLRDGHSDFVLNDGNKPENEFLRNICNAVNNQIGVGLDIIWKIAISMISELKDTLAKELDLIEYRVEMHSPNPME